MNNKTIIEELISAGASATEASDLAEFENQLNKPQIERSYQFKADKADYLLGKIENRKRFEFKKLLAPASIAVASLSLVTASAFAAQSSIPGDPLYALKRISERVFQTFDPQFSQQIPVRRSEEIKKLIENKDPENLVKKTIQDYQETKKAAPRSDASKEVRDNLQQAEQKATGESKVEIKKVLDQGSVEGQSTHEIFDKSGDAEEPTDNQKENNMPQNHQPKD